MSAAGDVNGDGVDDLLIGALGADPNGSDSGASYVVFGQDITPPDTRLTSTPPNPDTSTSPSFGFSGTDAATPPASLGFECRLDGAGFSPCTSPKTTTGLSLGMHTFECAP